MNWNHPDRALIPESDALHAPSANGSLGHPIVERLKERRNQLQSALAAAEDLPAVESFDRAIEEDIDALLEHQDASSAAGLLIATEILILRGRIFEAQVALAECEDRAAFLPRSSFHIMIHELKCLLSRED